MYCSNKWRYFEPSVCLDLLQHSFWKRYFQWNTFTFISNCAKLFNRSHAELVFCFVCLFVCFSFLLLLISFDFNADSKTRPKYKLSARPTYLQNISWTTAGVSYTQSVTPRASHYDSFIHWWVLSYLIFTKSTYWSLEMIRLDRVQEVARKMIVSIFGIWHSLVF